MLRCSFILESTLENEFREESWFATGIPHQHAFSGESRKIYSDFIHSGLEYSAFIKDFWASLHWESKSPEMCSSWASPRAQSLGSQEFREFGSDFSSVVYVTFARFTDTGFQKLHCDQIQA